MEQSGIKNKKGSKWEQSWIPNSGNKRGSKWEQSGIKNPTVGSRTGSKWEEGRIKSPKWEQEAIKVGTEWDQTLTLNPKPQTLDPKTLNGTQIISIFEGQPPQNKAFPIKTGVIWVPGDLYIYKSKFDSLINASISDPKIPPKDSKLMK